MGFLFTVEVDVEGKITLPEAIREVLHATPGAEVNIHLEYGSPDLVTLLPPSEARLEIRNGWPVIVSPVPLEAVDIRKEIKRDRAERMAHVAGPGFSAEDFL